MTPSSRSEKIRSILEARRPMAAKVAHAADTLNSIDQLVSGFRSYIPAFASKIDPDVKYSVESLIPSADGLILEVSREKAQLTQLACRYDRSTLNIGVVGSAGQGKSTLLQRFTGLSSDEIPSGDKGHCTGAASIVINQDNAPETYAEVVFHSPHSFMEEVVNPFFIELGLSPAPSTVDVFASFPLPAEAPKAKEKSSHVEILNRLRDMQLGIPHFRKNLNGCSITITKDEIRSYIAQESIDGKKKFYTWMAVVKASIYCNYPHADVGSVAFADTPGIGDFISGAEERLVETVGRNLDAILMLRRPKAGRTIIEKEDNDLYDLMKKAIPELDLKEWSYFIANKAPENSTNIGYYLSDVVGKSSILTRFSDAVNCSDPVETSGAFDKILNDIAVNLSNLDRKLFDRRAEALRSLGSSLQAFAEKARITLPTGVARPDSALFTKLFNKVWVNLGNELGKLAEEYRSVRDEPDSEFLATVEAVFKKLDEGPGLPGPEQIAKDAKAGGLEKWYADKRHALRVRVAGAFESVDQCLQAGFDRLRGNILSLFQGDDGGRLGRLISDSEPWQTIRDRLEQNHGEDGRVMAHAVDMLLTAGLSFRGFIQPRVRHCLDVLDSEYPEAKPFDFAAGDTPALVTEKLELAWENAVYNMKKAIEEMAKDPAMAKFAAAQDFREAVIRTGGEGAAKDIWRLFYEDNRAEVWSEEFIPLEENTRLRKEWENSVQALKHKAEALQSEI